VLIALIGRESGARATKRFLRVVSGGGVCGGIIDVRRGGNKPGNLRDAGNVLASRNESGGGGVYDEVTSVTSAAFSSATSAAPSTS